MSLRCDGRPEVLMSGGGRRSAGVTLLLLFLNCFFPRPVRVVTLLPLLWREVGGRETKLAIVTADLR